MRTQERDRAALTWLNDQLRGCRGATLAQLAVGVGEVQLRFDAVAPDALALEVQVEAPIAFRRGAQPIEHEPYSVESVTRLMALLGQELESASITDRSSLALDFTSDRLLIHALPMFEAWNLGLTGPDTQVVCAPGGDLAIFGRDSGRSDGDSNDGPISVEDTAGHLVRAKALLLAARASLDPDVVSELYETVLQRWVDRDHFSVAQSRHITTLYGSIDQLFENRHGLTQGAPWETTTIEEALTAAERLKASFAPTP